MYLVIRRQFHRRHTVNVFLDLVEEVVPASNDPALVLVVDQVKLIALPDITHLSETLAFNFISSELLQTRILLNHLLVEQFENNDLTR